MSSKKKATKKIFTKKVMIISALILAIAVVGATYMFASSGGDHCEDSYIYEVGYPQWEKTNYADFTKVSIKKYRVERDSTDSSLTCYEKRSLRSSKKVSALKFFKDTSLYSYVRKSTTEYNTYKSRKGDNSNEAVIGSRGYYRMRDYFNYCKEQGKTTGKQPKKYPSY